MNEFDIIHNLRKIIKNTSALKLYDDVFFDKKNSLIASIDTFNETFHYPNFNKPDLIIKKVVRSSISDIISKGIDPKFILITISGSKNQFTKNNIKLLLNSIKQEQKKYNFSLIGGDITSSVKSSFTVCSLAYCKNIIKRINCFVGDDIYVTGNIGDSSVGLSILNNKLKTSKKFKNYFIKKYFEPKLAYGFHRDLFKAKPSKFSRYFVEPSETPYEFEFETGCDVEKFITRDHIGINGDNLRPGIMESVLP